MIACFIPTKLQKDFLTCDLILCLFFYCAGVPGTGVGSRWLLFIKSQ